MDSFVFYKSFYEAVRMLPPDAFKEAVNGLLAYVFDEEEPEFESTTAEMFFILTKPQIDANNKRRVNGAKGGAPAGNQNAKKQLKQPMVDFENNQKQPNVNVNANVNVNDNVNNRGVVINNNILKEPDGFTPPTKDNVIGYCQEVGLSIDVDKFMDHYASVGWMSGSNKVYDWKAKVRNWARGDEKEKRQGVSGRRQKSKAYDGRNYDSGFFAGLEKEAAGSG